MQQYAPTIQRVLLFGLLIILLMLGFHIIKYFIIPVVWAAIITYMTWPIYRSLQRYFGMQRSNITATIMLIFIVLVIGIPLIFAVFILQLEGRNLYFDLQKQLFSGHFDVPQFIHNLPLIGKEITGVLTELNNNPDNVMQGVGAWLQSHIGYGKLVLSEITRNVVKLCIVVFSLFFFYRDGQTILKQVSQAMEMVIGPRVHHYTETISETTRAVVYGIGLTAMAQAVLAGLSYFVAGVPNPMVLTIITFIVALIPFGTPFAYTVVALWLFSQNQTMAAVGVMLWGVCVVSTIDNLIRPMVISGATKIPFLLIMFGVLGGLASFGLVGLFIGPVILAILLAIWREWLNEPLHAE